MRQLPEIEMVTFEDNVLIGDGAVPMKYVSQGQQLQNQVLKLEFCEDPRFVVVRCVKAGKAFEQWVPMNQVISIVVGPAAEPSKPNEKSTKATAKAV